MEVAAAKGKNKNKTARGEPKKEEARGERKQWLESDRREATKS